MRFFCHAANVRRKSSGVNVLKSLKLKLKIRGRIPGASLWLLRPDFGQGFTALARPVE
jgi:hypothetical protein